ncbi:MAG TPA: tRNA epoxyqueuosine(34) reductase QueG [Candidatus Manganitrophaceae bacterium]|nr:tRNA epoxyqueuosine(34) reductase QueG [Candidatus Manganitrophaceae bacterium]
MTASRDRITLKRMETDPQTTDLLTQKIKAIALGLGFHRVGITSADAVEEDGRRFSAWLADRFAGEMAYLYQAPEERSEPKRRFPDAKRVISLALNYYQEGAPPPDAPLTFREWFPVERNTIYGKVARYAWGEDYHAIIEEKLASLMDEIRRLGGRCWKGYVDHGPLLERAFAQRAGVGFIGKNTNLITPDYGSWVFLAEVVTDLSLIEDAPAASQCGSCRICIEACPTGALTEPYRLDARKCLSYLTIENKGPIPETFLSRMEGWIFGCDICQEVCPFNRRPVATDEPRLSPERGAGRSLSVQEVASISDNRTFQERFGRTPLSRAKRSGLIRNARALEKSGEEGH